ncbi:MAG: hypothetical protein CVU00_14490 [Bacteroidetes bacterium HGW-Bacteroidetes-17]|jgi:hypothetical protein|nr:MAG: hypothetical protein CVU00_14490 [Bacteroidetes bacterium HGW-Bacteroidetes-17]
MKNYFRIFQYIVPAIRLPFQIQSMKRKLNRTSVEDIITEIFRIGTTHLTVSSIPVLTRKFTNYYQLCNFYVITIMHSKNSCLLRSLLLFTWCVRCNLSVTVHIGVQRNQSAIMGHAWIEFNQISFREPETTKSYTTMLTYDFDGREFSPV